LRLWQVALVFGALLAAVACAGTEIPMPRRLAVAQGHFTLDGKPIRIVCGAVQYPRIPRAYWRQRLRMAKAMGFNAVTAYVFWKMHERSVPEIS
jgi:beta-galactosidase